MHVTIFILCYNEMVLIPHTIQHYRRYLPNAEIVILDNESTDNSAEIAKSLGCKIISWKSPSHDGIDDHYYIQLKNNVWKSVESGWILVCDMDEWLCVSEEQLQNELQNGTSILKVIGLNMIGDSQNKMLSDIEPQDIHRYIYHPYENKSICFLKDKIDEMNYSIGAHCCNPEGDVNHSSRTYINKHMEFLGEPFYINKYVERAARVKEQRKRFPNMGMHYTDDIGCLQYCFREYASKASTMTDESKINMTDFDPMVIMRQYKEQQCAANAKLIQS